MSCGKHFKNKASLKTHKYRYHPYSKPELDSKSQTSGSDEDNESVTDSSNYHQITMNKYNVELLQNDLDRLRKRMDSGVEKIDVTLLQDGLERLRKSVFDIKMGLPDQVGSSSVDFKEELEANKNQSRSNKVKLATLENKLENCIDSTHVENDVVVEDLLDDLKDIKQSFMNHQYEELLSDIPKIRLVAKFVVKAVDNIDMEDITDEDVELLEEIGESSKAKVRTLLKSKLNDLVGIFSRLNIDAFYEENEAEKSESEQSDSDQSDSDSSDNEEEVNEDDSESSDSDHSNTAEHS